MTRTYVYGNNIDEVLELEIVGAAKYYYHTNVQGNVVALTDSAGTVVETYDYDIYGRLTAAEAWNGSAKVAVLDGDTDGDGDVDGDDDPAYLNDFIDAVELFAASIIDNEMLFQGRRLDAESDLYYFRLRQYDSVHGRFLSRDPAGYRDSYSLYQFVNNNPIFATDPSGGCAGCSPLPPPQQKGTLKATTSKTCPDGNRRTLLYATILYEAGDVECCENIVLVQAVKATKNGVVTSGVHHEDPSYLTNSGWKVDRLLGGKDAYYNYDTATGKTEHSGTWITGSKKSYLTDVPKRKPQVGVRWHWQAEACAFCEKGADRGKFYKCVKYGVKVEAEQKVVSGTSRLFWAKDLDNIVYSDTPSTDFMAAVKDWNAYAGDSNDYVDIPTK